MVKPFCKKAELSCEEQLAALKEEMEDVRRRTDDYVHEAKLFMENAVRSFQSKLAEELRPSLIEALEESEPASLTEEQKFFRRRLQEIRDRLRELGVEV